MVQVVPAQQAGVHSTYGTSRVCGRRTLENEPNGAARNSAQSPALTFLERADFSNQRASALDHSLTFWRILHAAISGSRCIHFSNWAGRSFATRRPGEGLAACFLQQRPG